MTNLTRARELSGRPVVTLDTAVDIAEVKDVIIDPSAARLVGFALRGRGFFSSPHKGVLAIGQVAAVGPDAVMISSERVLVEGDEAARAALAHPAKIVGVDVLTESGQKLGAIVDVLLRLAPEPVVVAGYELSRTDKSRVLMPLPEAYSVSPEALIVPDLVASFLTTDLSSLGHTAEQLQQQMREVQR